MNRFLITYDLNRPGQQYPQLWEALRQLGARRLLESVWYVKGNYNTKQLGEHLRQFIDANDRLLVVPFNDWWGVNLMSKIE